MNAVSSDKRRNTVCAVRRDLTVDVGIKPNLKVVWDSKGRKVEKMK